MRPDVELRPALRPEVRISPLLRHEGKSVHLVLDPATGARFRVGVKEYFIIGRLDGSLSLDQIAAEYAEQFGTRLGERQWQQILGLLYGKALMVDGRPAPVVTREPRQRHLVLVSDPARLYARIDHLVRAVSRPAVWWALAVLALTPVVLVAMQLGAFAHDVIVSSGRPMPVAAVILTLWASLAIHELAHGLAATALGGTVRELGIRWRLPAVIPYCEVTDLRFMLSRSAQTVTAAAGVIVSLLLLLPACAAWLAAPGAGLGALILICTAAALLNLLPVPPFDGYKIVECSLGVLDLSAAVLGRLPRRRGAIGGRDAS